MSANHTANDQHLPRTPLDLPKPTIAQMLGRALFRALLGSVLFSLGFVSLVGVVGLGLGWRPGFFGLAYVGGVTFLIAFCLAFLFAFLAQSRAMKNRAFTVTGFVATFFGLVMLVIFFRQLIHDVIDWFHYQPILVEQTNWITQKHRKELEDAEAGYNEKRNQVRAELSAALADIPKENEKERKEVLEAYLGAGGTLDDKGNPVQPAVEKLRQEMKQQQKVAKTDDERRRIRTRFRGPIVEAGGAWTNLLWDAEDNLEENRTLANMPLRSSAPLDTLGHFLFETPYPYPEAVGIWPALLGSLWLAFIMMIFAVPIGVGAALYLEEYRTEGRLARLIQVNINNLAGVPSIVFGILGAFVFVELIFKPIHLWNDHVSVRNVIGGGLTLALLTLPVVIVASQEAIRAVPNSIRQGAYALGATHWQVIWRQVLPMARPGILTGTILAVSRAIGEAAPLVLFGATTFVNFSPSPVSEFTVMPIQIYNWADRTTNPSFDRIVGATERDGIHVWEAMSGRTIARLRGHEGKVNAVAFNVSGQFIVSGGDDGSVRLWNASSFRQEEILYGLSAPVTCVAVSVLGNPPWIAGGTEYGPAFLWKPQTGEQIELKGHSKAVTCAAFSPDGGTLATGSADHSLILWDCNSGKKTVLVKHPGPVTAVRFAPDGTLFSASRDGAVRRCNDKGEEIQVYRGEHTGAVTCVALVRLGPTRQLLITGGADKKVIAWDVATGTKIQTLPEHADEVTAVDVINRDLTAVVSASKDQTVRYSELVTGKEMQTMQGRFGAVHAIALDPIGVPVQAWHSNMALASLVLLILLLALNAVAIVLRNRAQQRVRI